MNRLCTLLLSLLNSGICSQTEFHIAYQMLQNLEDFIALPLSDAALVCDVSVSRFKKFLRSIGFHSYSELKMYAQTHPFSGNQLWNRYASYDRVGQCRRFLAGLEDQICINEVDSLISRAVQAIHSGSRLFLAGSLEMTSLALNFQSDLFVMGTSCFLIKNEEDWNFYKPDSRDVLLFMTMTGRFLTHTSPYMVHLKDKQHLILISRQNLLESDLFLPVYSQSEVFDGYYWVLFWLQEILYGYWRETC